MRSAAQAETVAFLSYGKAFGRPGATIERRETHISIVFLVDDRAFKLKRSVAFSYLDFSTVELRRRNCEAEFRLGHAMAPGLYRALHSVTRESDGRLAFDGAGAVVDWLIEMRRFDESALFDRLASNGRLTPMLMRDLADTIAAFHAAADPVPQWGTPDTVRALIDDVINNLRSLASFTEADITTLTAWLEAELKTQRATIDRRNRESRVRRCHGDLHLRNICLLDGKPTLFDPIEFSDAIASIDVLYDLAFLLMDLIHRRHTDLATVVFNRYLDISGDEGGLGLMPLYLVLRAAIRAHVSAAAGVSEDARSYFALARDLSQPVPPVLVAVGGISGTGKTTLAQAIASSLGRAPGARVLRSDVIRKRLHGVRPEQQLPQSAYNMTSSMCVYETLRREALMALRAGQAVIADAAFLLPTERAAIGAAARESGVAFSGLWLEAPESIRVQRLAARRDDASDADAAVVRWQLAQDHGPIDWRRLDTAGDIVEQSRVALMLINAS